MSKQICWLSKRMGEKDEADDIELCSTIKFSPDDISRLKNR